MIKVSIIVPVYNVYPYLERCLDSLVQQTLKEIEIIIVNDGSTDESEQIIRKYQKKDDRIISLKKENGGLSDARNYGLPYAKGEYVAFVDSDDYVDVTMYEKMYTEAKRGDFDLVECDCYWEYPDGRKDLDSSSIVDGYFVDIRVMAWNKLYRRSLIEKLGIQFPKGLQYEDICFCYQFLPFVQKIGSVPEALYYYIQRKNSIANTADRRVREIYDILQLVLDYYQEKNIYQKYEKELEYLMIKFILGRNFYRITALKDRVLRKQYLDEGYTFLTTHFPKWKSNYYLHKKKGIRHRYYRMINPVTYKLSAFFFHYFGNTILKVFKG